MDIIITNKNRIATADVFQLFTDVIWVRTRQLNPPKQRDQTLERDFNHSYGCLLASWSETRSSLSNQLVNQTYCCLLASWSETRSSPSNQVVKKTYCSLLAYWSEIRTCLSNQLINQIYCSRFPYWSDTRTCLSNQVVNQIYCSRFPILLGQRPEHVFLIRLLTKYIAHGFLSYLVRDQNMSF